MKSWDNPLSCWAF